MSRFIGCTDIPHDGSHRCLISYICWLEGCRSRTQEFNAPQPFRIRQVKKIKWSTSVIALMLMRVDTMSIKVICMGWCQGIKRKVRWKYLPKEWIVPVIMQGISERASYERSQPQSNESWMVVCHWGLVVFRSLGTTMLPGNSTRSIWKNSTSRLWHNQQSHVRCNNNKLTCAPHFHMFRGLTSYTLVLPLLSQLCE